MLLVDGTRDELNNALRTEHYRDAREMQNMVLLVLDNLNCGNFRVESARNRILVHVLVHVCFEFSNPQLWFKITSLTFMQLLGHNFKLCPFQLQFTAFASRFI